MGIEVQLRREGGEVIEVGDPQMVLRVRLKELFQERICSGTSSLGVTLFSIRRKPVISRATFGW